MNPKTVLTKVSLEIGNRDGEAFVVRTRDGNCWLVLEADTFHTPEFFEGMGSTEQMQISETAFAIMADPLTRHPQGTAP